MRLEPLHEQVVVVFGASSGIGRDTALEVARRGARVVVAARGEPGLLSLVRRIRDEGGTAEAVVADATDYPSVKAVADRAVARFGRLDTWIHAAAVSLYAAFEDTTLHEWKHVIDVNLNGQAFGAMAALPHLHRRGKGALIFVASVLGRVSAPLQSAYTASKHGLVGLAESLRMELDEQQSGIQVTTILPGTINTPLFSTARSKLGRKPQGLPPFYPAHVVAEAIAYACEHRVREMPVGGMAELFLLSKRLAPRLTDAWMRYAGHRMQTTDEPRLLGAPDDFDAPVNGAMDRVEGDFSDRTLRTSAQAQIAMHKGLAAIIGITTGMVALALARRAWVR